MARASTLVVLLPLKSGADSSQELTEKDFTTKAGKALLIAELGGKAKRYRPQHDEINGILPAAPDSRIPTISTTTCS